MYYIRFLKPPSLKFSSGGSGGFVKSLITVTSDLGDTFYPAELLLKASIQSNCNDRKPYVLSNFRWKAGMRCLEIILDIRNAKPSWPARIHVGPGGPATSMNYAALDKLNPLDNSNLPRVISAWSGFLDPPDEIEAAKLVERRFPSSTGRVLSIWEETGESIACHIWDAGVAFVSYLDQVSSAQREDLPILNHVLLSNSQSHVSVIELGAGCGIVGIGLAQMFPRCNILLTDLPVAQDIICKNIAGMHPAVSSQASFHELDWDDPLPLTIASQKFDIILVSDCTYNPCSLPSLVRTLFSLIYASPKALLVVAQKVRHSSEAVFFDLVSAAGLSRSAHVAIPLGLPKITSSIFSDQIDVYVFEKS
ncbi:MAG: hypothetical protein M1829_003819 [Trizodia sp. TS-e1964]|nr:MAG: hypothetical protein M1829_003819 [Trizodia sp. TS-e1964]